MMFLKIMIGVALLATLLILLTGVIAMSRGGEFNRKYGNYLMRFRVVAQFSAIILIVLFAILAGGD
jgi:hypothetical protein